MTTMVRLFALVTLVGTAGLASAQALIGNVTLDKTQVCPRLRR
jgi:hypothetical protein